MDIIDLDLLSTLRTFSDAGGVAKAARLLGRTQPAISTRLRQLERMVGASLFERVGRRLQLNPLGRSLNEEAGALLGNARLLLERIQSHQTAVVTAIRLGSLPTIGVHLIAPALRRLLESEPRVQVHLRYGPVHHQIEALREGSVDLVASVGTPPRHPDLRVSVLRRVRPVLVSRRRGRGRRPVLEKSDLLVFAGVADPFMDAIMDFIRQRGLEDRIRATVPHTQTLKALVAAGHGVAFLPDYTVVEPELATHPVAGLDFGHPLWVAARISSLQLAPIRRLYQLLTVRGRAGRPSGRS
jgi:LysR family hydrogen peroxide-inducible transcriptional activator